MIDSCFSFQGFLMCCVIQQPFFKCIFIGFLSSCSHVAARTLLSVLICRLQNDHSIWEEGVCAMSWFAASPQPFTFATGQTFLDFFFNWSSYKIESNLYLKYKLQCTQEINLGRQQRTQRNSGNFIYKTLLCLSYSPVNRAAHLW